MGRGAFQAGSQAGRAESIPPVVLLHGPERALADRNLSELRKTIEGSVPRIEVTTLDAGQYQKGDLITLTSSSLFADERLLIISGLAQPSDAFEEEFLEYLDAPVPGIWVVAMHAGGNRAPKVPRKVKAKGFAVIKCAAPRNDGEKAALVRDEVRRNGGTIDALAAESLVAALGSDLSGLLAAASQLVFDSGGTITSDSVHTFYQGRVETKPYEVAEALADQSGARALLLVRQAFATGVNPVVIVSVLATKFRALTKLKSPRANASTMKMPSWQVNKAIPQSRRWDERSLAAAMVILAGADEAVKGKSRSPESAVELAIMKIARLAGA